MLNHLTSKTSSLTPWSFLHLFSLKVSSLLTWQVWISPYGPVHRGTHPSLKESSLMREEIGKPSININTTVNKLCASSNTDSKDQNRTGMNYTIETPEFFKNNIFKRIPLGLLSLSYGRCFEGERIFFGPCLLLTIAKEVQRTLVFSTVLNCNC